MELRKYFFFGFLISILGMLLVIIAPGNRVRQVFFPSPPGFFDLIKLSIQFGMDFLRDTLLSSPLPIAVVFLWAFVLTVIKNNSPEKFTWIYVKRMMVYCIGIILTTLLLVIAICAPSVYAQTAFPEARALTSGIFILVICFIVLGVIFGSLLTKLSFRFRDKFNFSLLIIASLILCAISIYPIRGSIILLSDLKQASNFSSSWDNRFRKFNN